MKTLYDRIKEAWAEHAKSLPEGVEPWNAPPHIMALEEPARKLDVEFGKQVLPYVDNWKDGLIATVELYEIMVAIANKTE